MLRLILLITSVTIGLQVQAMTSDILRSIDKDFTLPRMGHDFSDEEIAIQLNDYPSELSFLAAAKSALNSFINDSSGEDSPLAVSFEDVGDKAGKKNLFKLLNHPDSIFGLVVKDSYLMPTLGEKLDENWIFYLTITNLDFVFWAIVDRAGNKETYSYGSY